ncbi:senescence-specific cysteine protease SAG39-like [Chlorella sorokiniana]|uniref:Senescence-specific cysteine protease SAG39-like n=1 Tax=Chlorella sorokiniana TaxID=3076 RepID=A0A2P6TK78_CHLSO|nr:senescence-specific cysteine protease SAG39-like [Chlorella sorokiniana]|eukprot:PRW44493.1 senescence-specific cysteine protease SAG39-like [Chlorella sorokiniana]
MPRLAAALLLLACSVATARAAPAASWPFAFDEDDICPPLPAATVQAFAEGTAALTKGTAANLACHLNQMLGRYDASNATAKGQLRAILRYIASVNTLMSNKWWAGLNSYSDLSAQEFAATVLQTSAHAGVLQAATSAATGSKHSGARKLLARYVPPPVSYPLTINWATAGRVLPQVSFQGQCSWAFAAASALESRFMIGTGTNTSAALSAQHIMDCAASMGNYSAPSCTGGSPADAFAFAAATGVATDDGYPYRGLNGNSADAPGHTKQCDRGFLTGQAAKQGTVQISGIPAFTPVPASKLGLITALAAQPLVASIGVDPSFQHYAGGIWSSTDCDATVPAQVMLVVGYDVTRYGQEHFIAKDSLGAAWGEGGSMRVAMSDTPAGTCGLYLRALQPGTVTALAATMPGNGKGSGKSVTHINQLQVAEDYLQGSHANLTGDGWLGEFYYATGGMDTVIHLYEEGNKTANHGVLVMLSSSAEPFNATDGAIRPDLLWSASACCSGTACSDQAYLSLPPIYLVTRTNYTEPTAQPPAEWETDRPVPATCNASDPSQAWLTFPWSATFTLYTCG